MPSTHRMFAALQGSLIIAAVGCQAERAASPTASASSASSADIPAEERYDSIEAARKRFEAAGVRVGQPLPALTVHRLDGAATTLDRFQSPHGMVIVTVSLTCPIARRECPKLEQAMRDHDAAANIVHLYTIDAHPKVDESPYRPGHEWITESNQKQGILVRQPVTLEERLALARDLHQRLGGKTPMVVDAMDNAAWKAFGGGPNVALLVDTQGKVTAKQGWLDPHGLVTALSAHP